MDKPFDFHARLKECEGVIPEKFRALLSEFYLCYVSVLEETGKDPSQYGRIFGDFLSAIVRQVQDPYPIEPYHVRVRKPFDYYAFGLDFVRPLIDFEKSTLSGENSLAEIEQSLQAGENVILFANHQIEADPQVISLLLEENSPKLAEGMIFVAGDRVVTDPLAVPFSLGRNLLCIFSKKYIDTPPEKRLEKQLHNKKTMELMAGLLKKGGQCIYVAPSGGRDRTNRQGIVEVAPFDAQSVEMFHLMSRKAKRVTNFYPLSLKTYDVLPPPETVQKDLGESRLPRYSPVHLHFGSMINMEGFSGEGKKEVRETRAKAIWEEVKKNYCAFD